MSKILQRIIYQEKINSLLRNFLLPFKSIIPNGIKIPINGVLKINVDKDVTIKIKTNPTSYISKQLFWDGWENYEYASLFYKLIQKVDSFYDIGTNIGVYTILAGAANKNIQIECFEPSIGTMNYLSENIKINHLEKIARVNVIALSDQLVGEIDFFEVTNKKFPTIYNLSGQHNIGTKTHLTTNKTSIKTTTLDHFVANNNGKPALIKLDTEGCEHTILEHSFKTIDTYKPIIICETLFNKIEAPLEKIMKQHSYEFYNHTPKGLVAVNTIKRTEDDGIRNCFFVHPSKKHLIEEFIIG